MHVNNKVIVQLNGGLGNQMFQYAVGRAIAHRNQAELCLDKAILKRSYSRPYQLECFQIRDIEIHGDDIKHIRGEDISATRNILEYLREQIKPRYKRKVFKEQSKMYDPEIEKVKPPVYLVGYWQSEKYFCNISAHIRREFTLKDKLSEEKQGIVRRIKSSNAVSIHIRRGDYVSNPVSARRHGALPLEYYLSAAKLTATRIDEPEFFVFSDDILWAKEKLRLPYPMTYVSDREGLSDGEELYLISLCRFHIIANSSFSWWGAWLSDYTDKFVFAPRQWFADPSVKEHDTVPDEWIQI